MKTLGVIGLPLACTDYAGAIDWVLARASNPTQVFGVEAANTHVAALRRKDKRFRSSIDQFDLIVPDGMPLVWVLNAKLPTGEKLSDRVYGPALMWKTLEATRDQSEFRHFLLGGNVSTLAKLRQRITTEHQGTQVVGTYSPPFGEWPADESEKIANRIRESKANLIWVALGCPKQENWIAENKSVLPNGVYFGIGAAFAFHAGEVSQAPEYLQKRGLEWAYRAIKEPKRLFRRYLTYNAAFLRYLVQDHVSD